MKLRCLIFSMIISALCTAQVDSVAVKSIEGITNKMLELISGPIGEERDWASYRNLFLPTAQKVSVRFDGRKMDNSIRVMNIEEFIRYVGPLYSRDGFLETSITQVVNEYNGIATVFQSYESKNLKGTYESRGINSYQLVYMQDRWWIANTLFTNEDLENPIPPKYLN